MCLGEAQVPPSTHTRSETRTDVGSEGAAKPSKPVEEAAVGGRGQVGGRAARGSHSRSLCTCSGQGWRKGEKGAEMGEADTCSQGAKHLASRWTSPPIQMVRKGQR